MDGMFEKEGVRAPRPHSLGGGIPGPLIGGNQAVIGVWTDKPSRGKKPPVKTLLVEPEPMKVGSLHGLLPSQRFIDD